MALFCNANARRHNFSSLTGVGLACGAGVCLFGEEPAASDAATGKAMATRQKKMKTRGNLLIIGSYFSSEC